MKTLMMLALLHGFMLMLMICAMGTKNNVKHIDNASHIVIKAIIP